MAWSMSDREQPKGSGYTSTPVPDPTVLTTQALEREVTALRASFTQRLDGLQTEINARFQQQVELLDRIVTARTTIDAEIQKRTDLQFTLVEQQRVEQKSDTRDAVIAALTAQKEAIAKAETSTNKQIEQLQTSFKTEVDALRRSIDENKERINDVATTANSYGQQKQGGLDTRTTLAWGITAVLGILLIVGAILAVARPG